MACNIFPHLIKLHFRIQFFYAFSLPLFFSIFVCVLVVLPLALTMPGSISSFFVSIYLFFPPTHTHAISLRLSPFLSLDIIALSSSRLFSCHLSLSLYTLHPCRNLSIYSILAIVQKTERMPVWLMNTPFLTLTSKAEIAIHICNENKFHVPFCFSLSYVNEIMSNVDRELLQCSLSSIFRCHLFAVIYA